MSETDVWDFYMSLSDRDREHLTAAQRDVAAICDLRQEVNSGGFDSYFRYWGGNTANRALSSLDRVLGNEWAELLREAMLLLGPEYPTDVDDRETALDAGALGAPLDALDVRFYDLEATTDADRLLKEHLARGETAAT
ncbi:MAG: DUF4375 domain-containing protein [Acidimicrobiia bacterium]|nr:DUF4375 domain-containing protein [Acidimicrobiia bacterium]